MKLAIALPALVFSVSIFAQPATQTEIAGEIAELTLKLQATKEVEEHLTIPCIVESYKQGGWHKQGDNDAAAAILGRLTAIRVAKSSNVREQEAASKVWGAVQTLSEATLNFVVTLRMNEEERIAMYEPVLGACFRLMVPIFSAVPR